MNQPLLIVITGTPGAGKTTLGKKIAAKLMLPFIHKDGIKEVLFERLGAAEHDQDRTIPLLSYDLLYYFLDSTVSAGQSLIIESNFVDNFDTAKITTLQKTRGFKIFQILCTVDDKIAFDRFTSRIASGERHPGHSDYKNLERFQQMLIEGREYQLRLQGELYTLNMDDFALVDHNKLFDAIHAYWGEDGA